MEVLNAVNSKVGKNYNRWNCSIFHHDEIREEILQNGIHVFNDNGHEVDIYVSGLIDASRLPTEERFCIIFMSAAISDRGSKDAPFFTGIEVGKKCNLPVVAISDPTLDIDKKLNLGWYAGNINQIDLQDKLVKIVECITSKYELKPIFVGGSGGGFAAAQLALNSAAQSFALIFNPQTDITKYHRLHVEKYLRLAFDTNVDLSSNTDEAIALFERFSINYRLGESPVNSSTKILYLQNKSDSHLVSHAKPYLAGLSGGERRYGNYFRFSFVDFVVGNWGDGHHAPPVSEIVNVIQTIKNNDIDNLKLKFSLGSEDISWNDFDKQKFFPFVVKIERSLKIELIDSLFSSAPDPEFAICLYRNNNLVFQSDYQEDRTFYVGYVDFDSMKVFLKDGFGSILEQSFNEIHIYKHRGFIYFFIKARNRFLKWLSVK
ncbi:hypothetical protein Q7I15_05660 [Aeromonas veronii]|uniref:hypothetical protein n=1 Tax=Aeromonas veronii TaxID=654 RepID=UPI0030048AA7